MEYFLHLAILIFIYLILAQSFNLNFGLAGQFNLAHVASYAIGAYSTALLSTELNAHFIICITVSVLLSSLLAILLGAIATRLKADYFAIGTLSFSFVVTALLINWKSLTRGVLGIAGIPRPEVFGYTFSSNKSFLILVAGFSVFINLIFFLVFKSSYARSLKAQAEYDQAAQALAKDTIFLRNISFFIASALAGLAGSFFAYYLSYIDPGSFSLTEMIFVLTIVVVGRPGSFWGVVVATIFLVLLPEPLRFIEIPASILGQVRQLIYALILFLVVWFNKAKLFPVQRII